MSGKTQIFGDQIINGTITNTQISATAAIAASKLTPPGSTLQLIYNNAGAFAGASGITTNGSNLTMSGTLSVGNIVPPDLSALLLLSTSEFVIAPAADGASLFTVQAADTSAIFRIDSIQRATAVGPNSPAASAVLDAQSTTKGFLAPRMTTTQKNAIVAPATGLIVYDTTLGFLQEYNGTAWGSVAPVTTPAGSSGNVQYNNGGVFGGAANVNTDGTNLTLTSGTLSTNTVKATTGGLTLKPQADSTNGVLITTASGSTLMQYDTSVHRVDFINPAGGDILIDPNGGRLVINTWATAVDSVLYLNNPNTGHNWYLTNIGASSSEGTAGQVALFHAAGTGSGVSPLALNPTNEVVVNTQLGVGVTPVASAILQADSTIKGFLAPRMTTTQKNAIASPATGLTVYDTTLNLLQVYNGTTWVNAAPGSGAAGANTQIQFNNSGAFGASTNLTWDGTTFTTNKIAGNEIDVNGTKAIDLTVGTGRALVTSGGTFVLDWQNQLLATSGGTSIDWNNRQLRGSTGTLAMSWATAGVTLASAKSLTFTDNSTNTITLVAPSAITSSYTVKWPTAQGTSGTALVNDGSGNLSWGSAGAGTVTQNTYTVGTPLNTYTGSTTLFNLPFTYTQDGKSLQVMYNGQVLVSGVDYSETSNTSVTFTNALNLGYTVQFRYITPQTPSNTSVAQFQNYVVGTASGTYTGSLTVYNLPFAYTQDGKSLEVFYDGVQLIPGDDYAETTTTSITTTQSLVSGQKIAFRTISTIGTSAAVTALRENYIVGTASGNYTGSGTVFNLINTYTPGGINLQVYLDGDLQTVGATIDYVETNGTTVTFNNTLVAGQKVSFVFSQTVAATGTVTSATAGQLAYYPSTGSTVSGNSLTAAQVLSLFSYRRPNLVFSSTTAVSVETGLDGTSGDAVIMFPDGSIRTETSSTRYNMTITQNAVFNNATLGSNQGGLRTGSAAANTWYACYAVKVSTFAANWVLVADTILPLQANYATLNSNFGTNSWVYVGLIRYGDNAGSTTSILDFIQSGHLTLFKNTVSLSFIQVNTGAQAGTILTNGTSVTSVTYSYAAGTGNTNIPNNISFVSYGVDTVQSAAGGLRVSNSALTRRYTNIGGSTSALFGRVTMPAVEGVQLTTDNGASTNFDVLLNGFVDSVLGVGSNPFL